MTRGAIVTLSIAGGLVVAGLVGFGVYFAASDFHLSSLLPGGATKTPQFRTSYIDSTKKSCVRATAASSSGANQQQIDAYCDCVANGSIDILTDDDVKFMMDHIGSIPPTLQQRLQPVVDECLKKVVRN